jgi:predicted dienelactone hydrolase
MRPLEWVLVLSLALLTTGWAAGARVRRWVPFAIGIVAAAHLVLEGQRLVMWPAYGVLVVAMIGVTVRGSEPRAPSRSTWRAVARWAGALVAIVITVVPPWLWPVMRLPTPTGPHEVGSRWIVVSDSTRRERFATSPGAIREVPVRIWYPASPGAGAVRAKYADPREMTFAGMLPAQLAGQASYIRTNSFQDAPLLGGADKFPVLIFSHGFTGYASQNTPQMEELASRGYVVASIVHPGEATYAVFPDGRGMGLDSASMASIRAQMKNPDSLMAAMKEMMTRMDNAATPVDRIARLREFIDQSAEPLRSESVGEWASDTKAVVDRLEAMNGGLVDSPFAGRLDFDRMGVFGMSYGGATVGEFCRYDRRCKAGINIDGGQYGKLVDDSLTIPYLIVASDEAFSIHKPVLDLNRGPAFLIKVPETTHMGLTDLTLQGPILFRYTGLTGRLDPDRREEIMTRYIVGFFEHFLRGQSSPLFDGPSTDYPEVSIIKRNVP